MKNKKINVGLIGHGHLGKWHAEKVEQTNLAKLKVIIDRNIKNLSTSKLKYPGVKVLESLEDGVSLAEAFIIATPTSTHFELAKYLIENKKHVLCEKPLCLLKEEALELKEKALEMGVTFLVGHSERCHQIWEDLDISSQELEFKRLAKYHSRAKDVSVVDDLIIHDVDLIHYLLKEKVKSVHGFGFKSATDSKYFNRVEVDLITEKNKKIKVIADRDSDENERELSFADVKIDLKENVVFTSGHEYSYEKRDHLFLEQKNFYETIKGAQNKLASLDDGASAVIVCDAIKKSLQENTIIHLEY